MIVTSGTMHGSQSTQGDVHGLVGWRACGSKNATDLKRVIVMLRETDFSDAMGKHNLVTQAVPQILCHITA